MAQAPPTQADIDAGLESAKLDRGYAAARLAKAKEWRKLAESARKSAKEANFPEEQEQLEPHRAAMA